MISFLIIILILCLFVYTYLICLKPNTGRQEQLKPFENVYIAHRGLFDNSSSAPENSLAAFQKAVEAGFGIELDVHLTADRQLVVFHDDSLKRMCGLDKQIYDCTYQELQQCTLSTSSETIPLLKNVLKTVNGEVPLIIEIKPKPNCTATAAALAEMMHDYSGLYCIESFHPAAVAWFRKNKPDVIRGQLSTAFTHNKPYFIYFLLTNLLFNWYTKPDFIAYDHRFANQFSYKLCRRLYHVKNAAWTIKNEEQLARAKKVFQIFIFDSFIPNRNQKTDS